jgi:hypothetical protein
MVKKKTETPSIRQCANIRSRKHPDTRCPNTATQGEFCIRHCKNPTRFQEYTPVETTINYNQTRITRAVLKLQKWWKFLVGRLRHKYQGPATCIPSYAENQNDIYTLDATSSIPMLYRWSYADARKHLWLFDVRSLSMTRAQDSNEALINPYTREPIPETAERHFQRRCRWLRKLKYCLVHLADTVLTPEQLWHQHILDITLKYDMLGYHTCLNWFEDLSITQLYHFYRELWELWNYRLNLDPSIKAQVVPHWNRSDCLLFKWNPHEIRFRNEKKWWQKNILEVLDRFVSTAQLKEHKILGALYGMTAFAIVSPHVRQHYPWLVDMDDT